MPISVVVGGRSGSEGKGKVALDIARRKKARIVVRVGGTNSGHTGIDVAGKTWALRQLPASVLAPGTIAILPPGAIIDPEIFRREVKALGLSRDRVMVSPHATVISERDKDDELTDRLVEKIGSTGSGTGAALIRRIRRRIEESVLAEQNPILRDFLKDTSQVMRETLNRNGRIVIEGSQGFGLSLLHGGHYPKATSRDTTAATFVAEAGLSPMDVDEIALVLRCHPIRVGGDSGVLKGETTWAEIAKTAGLPKGYCELTTATHRVRRVGTFDPELVTRAINANNPTCIVLNHFDYLDSGVRNGLFTVRALEFLKMVESAIERGVDFVGTGPDRLIERSEIGSVSRSTRFKIPAPS
jgi:adenylosuccinate synthase